MTLLERSDKDLRSHSVKIANSELVVLASFFVLFLFVNLLTSPRYPIVWYDEVLFTDPAANLYLDQGFTSTAWPYQNEDEFFASYTPLYPLILSAWISVSGLSPTGVRSFNYVLIILAAAAIWLAVKRLNLVKSPRSRLLLVLLVLLGYGVSMSYRSGRVDMLTLLLAASSFLAYTHRSAKIRCVLLAALSILFPLAGLQLLAFTVILTSLLLFYLGKRFVKEYTCISFGLAVGVITLIVIYLTNGVLNDFIAHTRSQSSVGLIELIVRGNFTHRNRLPKDFSLVILMLTIFLMVSYQLKNEIFKWNSIVSFGFAVSLLIPAGMLMAGKFPTYYSWMAYIPLAICISSSLVSIKNYSKVRTVVLGLLILACLVGLPLQLAISAYDWEDRNHDLVENMVEANVNADDWVYCDYGAYYAVKNRAKKVFLPDYRRWLTAHQKQKISVLVISPRSFARVKQIIGGRWNSVGEGIKLKKRTLFEAILGFRLDFGIFAKKYHLRLYRRQREVTSILQPNQLFLKESK